MKIINVPGINAVGLNKTVGCEKAPEKIMDFLDEIYTNETGIPIDKKILDIEKLDLQNQALSKENRLIYDSAFKSFKENNKTFFIGGDHSISYALTRAFFDFCQSGFCFNQNQDETIDFDEEKIKEPCLIVFDAHPDVMPDDFSGKKDKDKNSKECFSEMKTPTHEEWLRDLIDDGFPVENILLIGVRNSDLNENVFLQKNKIRTMSINSFLEDISESCDIMMEFASGKELYVSIDIDVIDPAFAPATGYTEVGGFTSREFLYLVQRMRKMKNLKALDMVEINPHYDEKNGFLTTKLGAKILAEFF